PIGAAIGFGQRSDPTAFHGVSDIAEGRRARAQMNKKGEGSIWWFCAHNRSLFAFTSLMVYDGRPPIVKRNRGGSMRFRGRPVLESARGGHRRSLFSGTALRFSHGLVPDRRGADGHS